MPPYTRDLRHCEKLLWREVRFRMRLAPERKMASVSISERVPNTPEAGSLRSEV
jgi:hypothetical protein